MDMASSNVFFVADENGRGDDDEEEDDDEPFLLLSWITTPLSTNSEVAASNAPSGEMPKVVNILRTSLSSAPAYRTIPTKSISLFNSGNARLRAASWL